MPPFNLYFAGFGNKEVDPLLMREGGLRLLSYHFDKKRVELWRSNSKPVFLDSGAFSAHTKGIQISIDDLISYINERDEAFTCYAQLDHIPGEFRKEKTRQQLEEAPEITWKNYLYMRERVKSPDKLLPIFHQGEDFKHLQRMLDFEPRIDYIGISPANDLSNQAKESWIDDCFKMIRKSKNPNVKTHAFGMTSLKYLEWYPFYSADSTSWLMNTLSGTIMTKWGQLLISNRKTRDHNHFNHFAEDFKKEVREYVAKFGYTVEQLYENHNDRMLFNIHYLLDWARNYEYKPKSAKQSRLF